jgi:protein-disulfide isomerase/uncharacterized membrane protein
VGGSSNLRLIVALACTLSGAAVAGLLLFQHHGEPAAVGAVNEVCGDGQTSGCEQVARSSWSSLGRVPLAGIGLALSLALATFLVVALRSEEPLRGALASLVLVLLGAALGVDVALGLVQAFAVKAFCGLCVATYVLNAIAFAALWPARDAFRTTPQALSAPAFRPAVVGLALTAVAWVCAVTTLDMALEARSALRSATMLGAPASGALVPASSPGQSGPAGPDDAAHWRAEAQRLQAILEDPHKVDHYFADKAAREYAAAKVESVDLQGVPAKGATGAPVQVVEYADFLCPACRNLARALSGFLPQSGNRVEIFYKNYPLDQACNPNLQRSTHPGACLLALGGLCAQDQGKFWPYHDRVFEKPMEKASHEDVLRFASAAGLDGTALGVCLASEKTRERLSAQIAEAKRLEVQSTPTFYVNGKKLPRIEDFIQVVDKEAQAKGFAPLQGAAHPEH